MQILLDFIQENRLRLVDWFFQFDKDHSGDISREEFKVGLKETGLDLTSVSVWLIVSSIGVWGPYGMLGMQMVEESHTLLTFNLSNKRMIDQKNAPTDYSTEEQTKEPQNE